MKKVKNYYNYLKAIQLKSEYSSHYPPVIGVETTASCNLKCNKCPVGRERLVRPEYNFMNMSLYHKIIDEIQDNVMSVNLSYFGEPLINPNFFEYVKYAKEKRLAVTFYSNGIALNDRIIDNIIKYKVDDICFSVDCLPENYDFYAHMKNVSLENAKKQLENVIQNIEKLLIKIKKAGCNTRITVARMDAPQSTPLEVYESFWKEKGVGISSGGVIDWGGTIDRIAVTRIKAKEINCHFPYAFSVFSSGIVSMCHIDYNGDFPVGDVNKQTIKEIYNGERIREIRRKISNSDFQGLPCEFCRYEDFGFKTKNTIIETLKALPYIYNWNELIRCRVKLRELKKFACRVKQRFEN